MSGDKLAGWRCSRNCGWCDISSCFDRNDGDSCPRCDGYVQSFSAGKLDELPEFQSLMVSRLGAGQVEYGDKSFDKPVDGLFAEVEEEFIDIPNWIYILWRRVRQLRAICAGLEAERNRLLADIQSLTRQKREAEGTRNHPGPNTIGGCELSPAE